MILSPNPDLSNTPFVIILEKKHYEHYVNELLTDVVHDECIGLSRGFYKGMPVGFLSANFSPQIAIKIEQLAMYYGTRFVTRIGTCGGLNTNILLGQAIIHTGAIRGEGTSHCYIDSNFPAIVSTKLLSEIQSIAPDFFHTGLTWTTDGRYAESDDLLQKYSSLSVDSVEMETASLYVTAHIKKLHALSISIISDYPIRDKNQAHKGKIDQDQYNSTVLPNIKKTVELTLKTYQRLNDRN